MKQTLYFILYRSPTLICLFFVFLIPFQLPAQGWVKNYGAAGKTCLGQKIENCPDGGYALAGQIDQGHGTLLARLDPFGDTLWTRTFPSSAEWSDKIPTSLAVGPDGMIHCVMMDFHGWTATYVRFDDAGYPVASFPVFDGPNYDYLVAFALVSDGIVFAGAMAEDDSTQLLKKDFDGTLIWRQSLPTPGGVVAMEQSSEGDFVLLVETDNYEYEIVKTDKNGHFLWRTPETAFTYRGDIAVQANSDIVYAGEAIAYADIYLMKLSPDGAILDIVQDSIFPGIEKPVEAIAVDTAGNVFITGSVWFNGNEFDHDLLLLKYDPGLSRIAVKTFDYGETFWVGRDLVLCDESVVICGSRKTQEAFPGTFSTAWITVLKVPLDELSPVEIIPKPEIQPVVVYPNPFSDQLWFTFSEQDIGVKTLRMYNLEGKLLLEQTLVVSPFLLGTERLPFGVLFYQVEENGRGIASGRLIHAN